MATSDTGISPTDANPALNAGNLAAHTFEIEEEDSILAFWSTDTVVRAPYYVRPCRKRFDLYQLSATPPSQSWHKETSMAQSDESPTPDSLPEPGRKKKNPRDLDKLLDKGIEESMDASDPPAAAQPEVHTEPDRDEVDPDTKDDKPSKH